MPSESESEKRMHRDAARAFAEMFDEGSEADQIYWIVEPAQPQPVTACERCGGMAPGRADQGECLRCYRSDQDD
jgi:hypothetical protein